MDIQFSSSHPKNIFESFANNVNATIIDNAFSISGNLGEGNARQLELEDGLFLTIFDYQLTTQINATRIAVDENEFFPIICWLSSDSIEQKTDGDTKKVDKNSGYGIFFPSPKIDSKYTIPADSRNVILTITVSKKWLQSNLSKKQKPHVLNLVESGNPFFLFEDISFEMGNELEKINTIEFDQSVANIKLRSAVLNFVSLFIQKIEQREKIDVTGNINHADVEKLFLAKWILTTQYADAPEIKTLAENAAMSESKLQKLFKQVFGTTIHQFVLKVKIEEAKKLLSTKQFSVSEVGYQVGYSNLSHFTAAFNKQIGVNPKQYLLSL